MSIILVFWWFLVLYFEQWIGTNVRCHRYPEHCLVNIPKNTYSWESECTDRYVWNVLLIFYLSTVMFGIRCVTKCSTLTVISLETKFRMIFFKGFILRNIINEHEGTDTSWLLITTSTTWLDLPPKKDEPKTDATINLKNVEKLFFRTSNLQNTHFINLWQRVL